MAENNADAILGDYEVSLRNDAMKPVYGLIFDVDGVIADTEPLNARVTIRVFKDMFGVGGVKAEDFAAGIGAGAEGYIRAAAVVHGLKLSERQLKEAAVLRQRYFLETIRTEPLSAFPGVLDLIHEALARPDFRLAIATSGSLVMSRAILDSAKVPYSKMAYVSGDDVKKRKPDPQIFLLAAERLGLDPSRCVVIEDAPNGVQAAKSAGAKCIAVTNSAPAEDLALADKVVDSLKRIDPETIRRLVD